MSRIYDQVFMDFYVPGSKKLNKNRSLFFNIVSFFLHFLKHFFMLQKNISFMPSAAKYSFFSFMCPSCLPLCPSW